MAIEKLNEQSKETGLAKLKNTLKNTKRDPDKKDNINQDNMNDDKKETPIDLINNPKERIKAYKEEIIKNHEIKIINHIGGILTLEGTNKYYEAIHLGQQQLKSAITSDSSYEEKIKGYTKAIIHCENAQNIGKNMNDEDLFRVAENYLNHINNLIQKERELRNDSNITERIQSILTQATNLQETIDKTESINPKIQKKIIDLRVKVSDLKINLKELYKQINDIIKLENEIGIKNIEKKEGEKIEDEIKTLTTKKEAKELEIMDENKQKKLLGINLVKKNNLRTSIETEYRDVKRLITEIKAELQIK